MLPFLVGFIAEEMDFGEGLVLDVVQGIGFVPTVRENIKRDLPSDRKGQPIISKLLPEDLDKFFSDSFFLSITVCYHSILGWFTDVQTHQIIFFKINPLLNPAASFNMRKWLKPYAGLRSIATDGADIYHAITKFNESTAESIHVG